MLMIGFARMLLLLLFQSVVDVDAVPSGVNDAAGEVGNAKIG